MKDDKRWKYGVPPARNANFAWVQHMVHHLAPGGVAGFVLANGSMSSQQSGEGEIRRNLVEASWWTAWLPSRVSSSIPRRSRSAYGFLHAIEGNGKFRDRRGEILFIDARKLGSMVDRTHRELTDEDIDKITATYHAWRLPAAGSAQAGGEEVAGSYEDIPGFCKSASLEEVRKHNHVLTPGRYVGVEAAEETTSRSRRRWRD